MVQTSSAATANVSSTNWRKEVSVNPPHQVEFRPMKNEDDQASLVGQITITNQSASPVMFKVKTTSQDSYYVRPNLGIIDGK